MTMTYGFSASKNAFYLLEDKSAYIENHLWGDDVVEVSDELWGDFCGQPPKGKVRGADSKGMPCWVDAPAVSAEEHNAFDENEKEVRLQKAESEIFRLSVIKEVSSLSGDEEVLLKNWKAHLVDIYRTHPEPGKVVKWPSPPGLRPGSDEDAG